MLGGLGPGTLLKEKTPWVPWVCHISISTPKPTQKWQPPLPPRTHPLRERWRQCV